MPASRFGIKHVYSSALRRCAWPMPSSSSKPVAKRGLQVPRLELLEVERAARKHGARQPACAGRPVVPDVLQDVRHLQALTERHRQAQHDLALRLELRAMQAEKLRAHLADDTGDVVAVLRELIEILRAAQALAALKLRHPAAHDGHATRQRRALLGRAACVTRITAGRVAHEVVLGGQHAIGKQRRQIARELLGRLRAIDDGDEPRMKLRLLVVTGDPDRPRSCRRFGTANRRSSRRPPAHPAGRGS